MVRVERAFIIQDLIISYIYFLILFCQKMSRKIVSRAIRFPSEKIAIKCEKSMERIRLMCGDGLSVVAV